MKIVFMGTPDFAVPSLHALTEAGYAVAAVVTQPDKPKDIIANTCKRRSRYARYSGISAGESEK